MRPVRQTFVETPAIKIAVFPSVEQPTTNLTYVIKSTNAYVQNVSLRVINHKLGFVAFVYIIRVAIQENTKYNNLPRHSVHCGHMQQ
jgi:hypothetical protein